MELTFWERCMLASVRSGCRLIEAVGSVRGGSEQVEFRSNGTAWEQRKSLRHVAFIMDGNRRWARQRQVKVQEGHRQGFDKLKQALQWCLELGLEVVTVYAFSIENFRRGPEEVNALMDLAADKLEELVDERGGLVSRLKVRIEVVGELHLLPERVQRSAAYAMMMTKDNDKAVLNICLSYTARQDMTNAVQVCARGVRDGIINPSDVTDETISACLGTGRCGPVDLMLRTSGETRLSDFMLWESADAFVAFEKAMWPDLSLLNLAWVFFRYHWWRATNPPKSAQQREIMDAESEKRVSNLVRRHQEERWETIQRLVTERGDLPRRVVQPRDNSDDHSFHWPGLLIVTLVGIAVFPAVARHSGPLLQRLQIWK